MTAAAAQSLSESPAETAGSPPAGWEQLRADGDVQFAPVTVPKPPVPKPNWLSQQLERLFDWLGDLLAPLGQLLGGSWWWLQWVLLAAVSVLVLVLIVRLIDPASLRWGKRAKDEAARATEEWRPDTATSLALLEDADRLAAEGRYDEAAHLLLQRSVSQISTARPEWVEPSSTARELAALPALPDAARAAFGVIAGRVEASLFALRALDRSDWEAARAAYAEFALAKFDRRALAA